MVLYLDYRITDYPAKLDHTIANMEKIIYSEGFHNELSRFIPLDVQENTLKKAKFKDFFFLINETLLLLLALKELFDNATEHEEFTL